MDSASCIRQHGYVDLRRNELMDTRFIIYFVFICLKNFELSWVVCRINKVIRMNFVELGTITAFSEIAGFCFIVSRSQSADFLLWWKETVFLDRFACIGGFVIAVAVSTALLILLLLFKKQLKRGFVKLSVCVLFFCSPYLFFYRKAR